MDDESLKFITKIKIKIKIKKENLNYLNYSKTKKQNK